MGEHLAKDWRYIDPTKVYVDGSGNGTPAHLNSTKAPNDPTAATEWSWLTADGSDDGAFLKA